MVNIIYRQVITSLLCTVALVMPIYGTMSAVV